MEKGTLGKILMLIGIIGIIQVSYQWMGIYFAGYLMFIFIFATGGIIYIGATREL